MSDPTKLTELRQRTADLAELAEADTQRRLSGPDKWNEEAWVDAIAQDIGISVLKRLPFPAHIDPDKLCELARSLINEARKPFGST